jgi:purine-nucleoside phosphorylase
MIMNSRIPEYFALDKYNISDSDVVMETLGCDTSAINENVIVTPVWHPDIYKDFVEKILTIVDQKVYDLIYKNKKITLIQSGIGAPQTGDVILSLGCTKCKRILFTGSVGGLDKKQSIGDLLIVDYSITGDGFSNYLAGNLWKNKAFNAAYPDKKLSSLLKSTADCIINGKDVRLSSGIVYSTDTIIAQFMYIEKLIKKYKCIGIDMETSAVFNASSIIGIKASALLQFSDVIVINKSLFSGRTEEDQKRRKFIRKSILPKILLETLVNNNSND